MTTPQPDDGNENPLFTKNGRTARNIIRFDSFDGKIDKPFFDNLRSEIISALDAKDSALAERDATLKRAHEVFGAESDKLKAQFEAAQAEVERLQQRTFQMSGWNKKDFDSKIEALAIENHVMREALEKIPEINISNYNDEDVAALNQGLIDLHKLLATPSTHAEEIKGRLAAGANCAVAIEMSQAQGHDYGEDEDLYTIHKKDCRACSMLNAALSEAKRLGIGGSVDKG